MLDGPLPEWAEYYAESGVCAVFHPHLWPGVWAIHIGVTPAAWGYVDAPLQSVIAEFCHDKQPERVVGWVKESNRAVIALAKRVGFEIDGRLPLAGPVVMIGRSP